MLFWLSITDLRYCLSLNWFVIPFWSFFDNDIFSPILSNKPLPKFFNFKYLKRSKVKTAAIYAAEYWGLQLIYFTFIVLKVCATSSCSMTGSRAPFQYLLNVEESEDHMRTSPLMRFEPETTKSCILHLDHIFLYRRRCHKECNIIYWEKYLFIFHSNKNWSNISIQIAVLSISRLKIL